MSGEPRITVPCRDCHTDITLTVNWYRRRMRDHNPPRCELCKTMDGVSPDDDDLRFWLDAYGVTPNGSATDYVAEHGLPDQLVRLLGVISPEAA